MNFCMLNRYLLLSISLVDIYNSTAIPTPHDTDYTLQSSIIIAALFYIRYTQLLISIISIITLVTNIQGLTTTPTVHDP